MDECSMHNIFPNFVRVIGFPTLWDTLVEHVPPRESDAEVEEGHDEEGGDVYIESG